MKFWKSFLLGALFFGMTSSTALAVGNDSDPLGHTKITHVPKMNFGTHPADQTNSDQDQVYKISDHDQGKITPDDTSIVIESDSEQGFEVDVVFSKPKASDGTEIDGAKIILHGVRTHTTNANGTSARDQLDSDDVKTDLTFIPGKKQELANADYGEGQGTTIIDFDSVEIVLDPPDDDQTYTTKMEITVKDRPLQTPAQTEDSSENLNKPAVTDGTITQEVKTAPIAKEKLFDASSATAFDDSETTPTIIIYDDDYNNINWDQVGDYPVKFTATDGNNNSSTGTITVKIIDTIAPVVTSGSLNWEVNTLIPEDEIFSKSMAIATDNSGIAPTIAIDDDSYNAVDWKKVDNTNPQTVTFIATDPSGNSSTGTIDIYIVDTTAPVVTTGKISQVTIESPISINDIFSASKAKATDNSGIAPTITIDPTSYNTVKWGTASGDNPYSVQFTATDPSGNSSTGIIDVTINYEQILIEWLDDKPSEPSARAEDQINFGYAPYGGIVADSISWQQGTVNEGVFETDENYQPSSVNTGTVLDSKNNAVLMTFENLASLCSAFLDSLSGNVKISTYTATPNLIDISVMFAMTNLTSLDLSGFDTSAVQYMDGMFEGASSLENITFGKSFKTSKVTDMSGMFEGASSLESLDLKCFDTSAVQYMGIMFSGALSLKNITFGKKFKTSKVTDMSGMFEGASSLKSLDLRHFDTNAVQNMNSMFDGASELHSITFGEKFKTSKVTDMSGMFSGASSLKSLDLSSFSDDASPSFDNIFDGMTGMISNGIKLDSKKWSSDNQQILNKNYSGKLNWINNSKFNLDQTDLISSIIKK